MRTRLPRLTSAAAALSASALLLAVGGGSDSAADGGENSVELGVSAWIGYGMWHIVDDQDLDEQQNGLDLEVTSFDKGADRNAALLSGSLDAAGMGAHYALMLAEQGVDITIVQLQGVSLAADGIVTRGDISSVADLAGQQVAYEEGQSPDVIINTALDDNGMSIGDIETVPMSASEAGAAFVAGRIDVAVTYEPYLSEAKNAGGNVIYTAGEHPGLICDVLVFNNSFLEENPEVAVDMLRAYQAAYDYYEQNTDDGRAIIADAVGSDVESLSSAFDGLEYWDTERNREELSGAYREETLPIMVKEAVKAGILEKEPENLDELFDDSYINQA